MVNYKSKLWTEWCSVCNKYLKAFCEKHDYDYEEAKDFWVAGDVGTITLCGDEYVGMNDIITDIEMNAPEEEFLKWYDYCLECYEVNVPSCNYESWLKKCPIHSNEELKELKENQANKVDFKKSNNILLLKEELIKLIDEYIKKE